MTNIENVQHPNMYWVYHQDHEAKVVNESEYFALLEAGWVDNPAKCKKVVPVSETGLAAVQPSSVVKPESGTGTVEKATGKPPKPQKTEDKGDGWPRHEEKVKNDLSSANHPNSLLSGQSTRS